MVIHQLEVMPDYVHLLVQSDPTLCVAEIVNRLKGASTAPRVRLFALPPPHLVEPQLLR
jgi:REP element-mobilizing transposase RayT